MKSQNLAKALIKLSEKTTPEKAVEKFLSFADKKNLLSFLPRVLFYIEAEAAGRKEKNTLKISASRELSEEAVNMIKKAVGAPDFVPESVRTEPDLIGGFVAEYGGKIYDASVKRQLEKLGEILRK